MDAGLLDVLHDAGNHDIFTVRKRVDVDLDRVFEEVIDQHGTVLGILDRLLHVTNDRILVVGDHHGAATEHVRGPHQHGIPDALRTFDGLFERSRHRARGLRDFEFVEQFAEALAVFAEIDGFGRSPDDGDTGGLERQRQVERSLAAELHNHSDRSLTRGLVLVHGEDVF